MVSGLPHASRFAHLAPGRAATPLPFLGDIGNSTPAARPILLRLVHGCAETESPSYRCDYVRLWHLADINFALSMSAFGGKADMLDGLADVRFWHLAGQPNRADECPF